MNTKKLCAVLGIGFWIALLGACGGGGSSSRPALAPPQEQPEPNFGALKPAESKAELAESLRQGLSNSGFVVEQSAPELVTGIEDGNSLLAPVSGNFTTTNLQEAGVDEADILKYDGEILYALQRGGDDLVLEQPVLTDTSLIAPIPSSNIIRLLRTDTQTPSVALVATIETAESGDRLEGLYLHNSASGALLLGLGRSHATLPWEAMVVDYYWQEGTTSVTAWNVDDPAAPATAWRLQLEGTLLASRRIGNRLYLVTRYTPSVEGLVAYPQDQAQIDANRERVSATPLEDLLPDYWLDGGEAMELLSSGDCYLPNPEYTGELGAIAGGGVVTVTAVDLEGAGGLQSLCLNTNSSGFYASPDSLYLTWGAPDNVTLVHKISLGEDGPEYRGSGQVPGYIGTGNPAFLMSESGSDLRVISSLWTAQPEPFAEDDAEVDAGADFGPHRLTVLRENPQGTELEQLAQIPSASQPANIGKPGEQVFAARFLGDRAYIVTFELIDPLYVIDLSEPSEPRISGELELPGFSTLLQPLGENLLLGVGQAVPPEAEGLAQGIKVALFDVADIEAPLELGSEVIGRRGSHSPALNNHHTLTIQALEGNYRVALPIARHAHPGDTSADPADLSRWYDWSDSGLYLFEITPATGSLSLHDTLQVDERVDAMPWPQVGLYNARSVIHDEAVFLVSEERIWAREW